MDLPHISQNNEGKIMSKALLYADDTLVYAENFCPLEAEEQVNIHLEEINDYYKTWGIKINTSKSEAICIRNAYGKTIQADTVTKSRLVKTKIGDSEIPLKEEIKYLGVTFTNKFKFNKHGRAALKKAKNAFYSLKFLFYNKALSSKTKLLMYKQLIRPVISYAFPIWHAISPVVAKEMEIFERKIIRLAINKNYKTRHKRYSNKHIMTEAKCHCLMIYLINAMDKNNKRCNKHPNILVKEAVKSQREYNVKMLYYLSPFNYLKKESYEIMFTFDPTWSIPVFYRFRDINNYRG